MNDFWQGNVGPRDGTTGKLIFNLQLRHGIRTQAVTVGTTAVALPTASLSDRRQLVIFNNSNNTLYVGASDVTTANGIPVRPQEYVDFAVADDVIIYGVTDAAGSNIRICEGA